MMAAKYERVQS
jgi:hypothetical protein